ncbi:hypothetical protein FNF27_04154 [Cafeteria roenbergensis]|uniref:Uncharacterized protein n=1 Tax=Cafeteria roenbergensis TaxID=33653 RepID=A0A5A8E9H4_CAFRO|nr:hypothetical protein FNF29_04718 [Cafeteria roenbergensis]KAA0174362.1 hypothetical protein FNF27_04154 [Cafeteria roenbergensis]|eukprot:KAA0151243.1 hypothetical protein FNF29_04718 [Cafeteria roenbergensis]
MQQARERAANPKGMDFAPAVIASLDRTLYEPASELASPPHAYPSERYKRGVPLHRDMRDNPSTALSTRLVHWCISRNDRCSMNTVCWTPDGLNVMTGSASGSMAIWSGSVFTFQLLRRLCSRALRVLRWSHNGEWLLSADDTGEVLYWEKGNSRQQGFPAHRDVVRAISFSPTDRAFATCADDGVVKIWDFWLHKNTNTLKGHHSDVHDVDWHPTSALVASGSKDSTVKLWDPREGVSDAVRTLRDHSQPVHKVRWNCNGNWLASASQDRSVAIWDLRMMRTLRHFKPPCSEPTAMAWHPDHESLLAVGHLGGELSYWLCSGSAAPEAARAESEAAAAVPLAHDGSIWDMAWHPTGAMLATCGHDRMLRFWSRPRPGDTPAQYEHKGGDRRRERLGPAAAALVGTRGLAQMARAGGSVGGARYDELLKSSGAVDAGAAAPEARARSAAPPRPRW